MNATSDDKYLVPALQRGLELLEQFNRTTPTLTGADLARNMGLPRASVFRILHTLERSGFVERVGESSSYKLGIGVLRLGFEFLASMELTEYGRPVIEKLRDTTGYSAHLVVRDGRDVVFVVKAAGRSAMFHSIQVGARLPAHATVLGRLLLSDLDLSDLKKLYPEAKLPAYTDKTPTNLGQLQTLIEQDRANGYGLSQGGFETGISTIAAPVFNEQRQVVAAISVTVPAQSIDPEQVNVLVSHVQLSAAQLTQRLTHFQKPSST
jgi:DNA-binding IclR family transcriptional regulator